MGSPNYSNKLLDTLLEPRVLFKYSILLIHELRTAEGATLHNVLTNTMTTKVATHDHRPHPSLQDAGVKAMISGLVSASAKVLLSSSFNTSGSSECQKHHSKYIDLVAEWRFDMLAKGLQSVGHMFPSLDEETGWGAQWPMYMAGITVVVVLVGVLAARTDVLGRVKRVKLS